MNVGHFPIPTRYFDSSLINLCGVSAGGLNGLLHSGDLFIRQGIEMAILFSFRQSPIVLKTEANEEVDLPVGHVHDLLDGFFGLVIVGDERQFVCEFRIDGLFDETEKRFGLGRHINIAIPYGRLIMNSHLADFIERVFNYWHYLPGERFQRSVIVGWIFQHVR